MPDSVFRVAADAILVFHVAFVAFVVLGLIAVFIGQWRAWGWVRNYRFRLMHLLAIGVVVLQSWFGVICPLTSWEQRLREAAGAETYSGSFIAHWLHTLLYYEAPAWVFIVVYTAFGGLVAASWVLFPPRRTDSTE